MNDKFAGEILVLAIILICSLRCFFARKAGNGSLALLAPISLILAALLVLCWTPTIPEIIILVLAALTFLSNLRSLARLKAGLVIDSYSPVMVIFSLLIVAASLAAGAGAFLFRQVPLDPQKFGVKETRLEFERTAFLDGAIIPAVQSKNPLVRKPAPIQAFVFEKAEKSEAEKDLPFLLFGADPRSYAEDYRPLLVKLAARGYTVLCADNIGGLERILRRAKFRAKFLIEKDFAARNYADLNSVSEQEFETMFELCAKIFPAEEGDERRYWLLCDQFSAGGMREARQKNSGTDAKFPLQIEGTIDISSVEGCTPGFGSVEQADPWTAALLGKQRDHTFYSADHLARNIQAKLQSVFHE